VPHGTAIAARIRKASPYGAVPLAYVAAGKVGLMLAVPPGYATAIFLPAGIAVAAMLVGGVATLPWTFLGSLLLNIWEGYALNARIDLPAVTIAVVIAAASALQAGVAGTLMRRVLGNPAVLDNGRDLGWFVVLSPLGCLTSATLSHGGLWLLGTVRTSELASSWVTWWIGDTLGVLFVLPLALVIVGEPRALWRSRAMPVFVPMVLLFALFFVIYARASVWEHDQSLLEFRLLSQQVADEIDAKLEEQGAFLDQLERSFVGPTPPSRDAFRRLVERLPQRFPTIQAVEWAPRVTAAERAPFEAAEAGDRPGFAVVERDRSRKMAKAGARAEYYPVTYVEPSAGNEEAVGFDLASEAARRTAIETTLAHGGVTATAPVQLVQEHADQPGMLLVRALQRGADGPGVILVVLRMSDFLDAVVAPARSLIDVQLIDRDSDVTLFDDMTNHAAAAGYERSFAFGTRHYLVRVTPTAAYFATHRAWQSWAVLAVGVLSTALLGALLMLGTGQSHRFEQLVTERTRDLKASHERLHQAQKLEALGQFTAGIAHDFNNLLTVISGNLELLKARVSGESELRLIRTAESGAERGTRLTESLLAFSRRQVLRPEVADANRLIAEFEPLLRQSAGGLVELKLDLGPDLDRCLVDTAQLQSALLNLVTNARDACTGAGGRITIATANITVGDRAAHDIPAGRYVSIAIADTGSGMSEADAARAFEPFYTTKEAGKGSGLGLSQVHGFAQQSGGFVRLTSSQGAGTTVQLYLPRADMPAALARGANGAAPPSFPRPAAETVLVVDDDAEVCAVTAEMVGDLGYRVVTARDGPTALAMIESGGPVDLVITDYSMPNGMTGDVLVRRARERRQEIKGLLVSGFPIAAGGDMAADLPRLQKPYRRDDLARAIRESLGR